MKIGIIAITTPGATMCAEHLVKIAALNGQGANHPEYYIHARPTSQYINAINQEDWQTISNLVIDSVKELAKLGVTLFIMPSNTPHMAWDYIEKSLSEINKDRSDPIHFINLIDATVQHCIEQNYKSVLLLGTAQTMRGTLYQDKFNKLNISCYTPDEEDINFIDKYIKDKLIKNMTDEEDTNKLIEIIDKNHKQYQFDAVILGCTELPMILKEYSLPLIDTTYLLAYRASNV